MSKLSIPPNTATLSTHMKFMVTWIKWGTIEINILYFSKNLEKPRYKRSFFMVTWIKWGITTINILYFSKNLKNPKYERSNKENNNAKKAKGSTSPWVPPLFAKCPCSPFSLQWTNFTSYNQTILLVINMVNLSVVNKHLQTKPLCPFEGHLGIPAHLPIIELLNECYHSTNKHKYW